MLTQRVNKYVQKNRLLHAGDTVIVGTSGGADSTALLNILHTSRLNFRVIAIYVDHGLRPDETPIERDFIEQLTEKLNIERYIVDIDVSTFKKEQNLSLEEAARTLRYIALEEYRLKFGAQAIAVAHTADDQVEEFFIRTIRGSGLKGLCGMAPKSGHIIRPLLTEPKSTLIEYLQRNKISFCHDSSNDDLSFLRNRIRQQLLPQLEKDFNPSIRNTLLQTTSILTQDEQLLDQLATSRYDHLVTITQPNQKSEQPDSISFSLPSLSAEHQALQRRILEKALWAMRNKPSFRTIQQLQSLVIKRKNGAKVHLAEGLRVKLYNEIISFSYPGGRTAIRGDKEIVSNINRVISDVGEYEFQEIGRRLRLFCKPYYSNVKQDRDCLVIDSETVQFPMRVRSVRPGEKILPLGGPGRKKIARILSDKKIPAHLRNHHPLLVAGDEIVAILGVRIDESFKVSEKSSSILVIKWEKI